MKKRSLVFKVALLLIALLTLQSLPIYSLASEVGEDKYKELVTNGDFSDSYELEKYNFEEDTDNIINKWFIQLPKNYGYGWDNIKIEDNKAIIDSIDGNISTIQANNGISEARRSPALKQNIKVEPNKEYKLKIKIDLFSGDSSFLVINNEDLSSEVNGFIEGPAINKPITDYIYERVVKSDENGIIPVSIYIQHHENKNIYSWAAYNITVSQVSILEKIDIEEELEVPDGNVDIDTEEELEVPDGNVDIDTEEELEIPGDNVDTEKDPGVSEDDEISKLPEIELPELPEIPKEDNPQRPGLESPSIPDIQKRPEVEIPTYVGNPKNPINQNQDNIEDISKDKEVKGLEDKLNLKDHMQYIQGYPDNTVRAEDYITREEVAAVFYRLLNAEYRDSIYTTDHNFKDIGNRWSKKHIATLANANILTGYPEGEFKPSKHITRGELAAIASRFDNLSKSNIDKFNDINGHWAYDYINSAAEKGWIKGYNDSSFRPDQNITRAEFVTLVNSMLNRKVTKENILPEAKQFIDLPKTKWYYEEMQEAVNSHKYNRIENDYEVWTEIYYPEIEM